MAALESRCGLPCRLAIPDRKSRRRRPSPSVARSVARGAGRRRCPSPRWRGVGRARGIGRRCDRDALGPAREIVPRGSGRARPREARWRRVGRGIARHRGSARAVVPRWFIRRRRAHVSQLAVREVLQRARRRSRCRHSPRCRAERSVARARDRGGTGGLLHVLPRLPRTEPIHLHRHIADVRRAGRREVRRVSQRQLPDSRHRTRPQAQGFAAHHYDVVVAANVVHATATVAHARPCRGSSRRAGAVAGGDDRRASLHRHHFRPDRGLVEFTAPTVRRTTCCSTADSGPQYSSERVRRRARGTRTDGTRSDCTRIDEPPQQVRAPSTWRCKRSSSGARTVTNELPACQRSWLIVAALHPALRRRARTRGPHRGEGGAASVAIATTTTDYARLVDESPMGGWDNVVHLVAWTYTLKPPMHRYPRRSTPPEVHSRSPRRCPRVEFTSVS